MRHDHVIYESQIRQRAKEVHILYRDAVQGYQAFCRAVIGSQGPKRGVETLAALVGDIHENIQQNLKPKQGVNG